jgi:oligopeptide transport system ATP-binding protein
LGLRPDFTSSGNASATLRWASFGQRLRGASQAGFIPFANGGSGPLRPAEHHDIPVQPPTGQYLESPTAKKRARVQALLETVGMGARHINRYPHEFSGGQQQRIGIARALAVDPDFIVADEPISALDVSIQAQIINLIERLQEERSLTYLFISHDLRAIRHTSTRVAVMYLGRLVEVGPTDAVYARPLMPYTRALVSAVPVPDPAVERARTRLVLQGDVPSPLNPPPGCRFHTRCPYAVPDCRVQEPPLQEIAPGHFAACIRISPERPDIEANA